MINLPDFPLRHCPAFPPVWLVQDVADAGVVFVFVPDDWPDTIMPQRGEMLPNRG